MLYDEEFYPIRQIQNTLLTVRQAGRLNGDKSYRIERSNSKTSIVAYVETGCLHVEVGEDAFTVAAGQSLFLPSRVTYTIYADPAEPPVMYWLNLRGAVLDSLVASFPLTAMVCECPFMDLYDEICSLAGERADHFEPLAQRVFALLLRLRSHEVTRQRRGKELTQGSVYEAYICNHIQSEFSVMRMAEELSTSTDAINRLFLRQYNTTPYRYYQDMRMDFAKNFLAKTDLTIEDIAQRLRFTDRNYFSLYFKKRTGISPAAYRKAHRPAADGEKA